MCESVNVSFDAKLESTYDVCKNCGFIGNVGIEFPYRLVRRNRGKFKY